MKRALIVIACLLCVIPLSAQVVATPQYTLNINFFGKRDLRNHHSRKQRVRLPAHDQPETGSRSFGCARGRSE